MMLIDPSNSIVTVENTSCPPDDLNPFNLVERNLCPVDSAEIDFIDPSSIHQDKVFEGAVSPNPLMSTEAVFPFP